MKEKLSFYSYSKISFKLNISVKMKMNNHKVITFTDKKKKKEGNKCTFCNSKNKFQLAEPSLAHDLVY